MEKYIPRIEGKLRSHMLKVPKEIYQCSGISIFGKRIKSVLFSTDLSVIRNTNADAIMAVYPFTPQPVITRAIMSVSEVPVFCGVGGGITGGNRVIDMAVEAELSGAIGVVVNAPTPNSVIERVAAQIDIPVVVTIVGDNCDFASRFEAGAQIFNVSASSKTPELVSKIRKQFPYAPIIATGGPTPESITRTINAGANTITWTPPTSGEILKDIMDSYRNK